MKVKSTRKHLVGSIFTEPIVHMITKKILHPINKFKVLSCYPSTSAYLKGATVYELELGEIHEPKDKRSTGYDTKSS